VPEEIAEPEFGIRLSPRAMKLAEIDRVILAITVERVTAVTHM
jgi:hypothetical protein